MWLVCAVTTMESLGLTQFDVIDSAHSGGELLGYAAEGMLRTNAERVGEAVEEQHTMETAAAALGTWRAGPDPSVWWCRGSASRQTMC